MAYRHNSAKKVFVRSRATLDFYPLPHAYFTGLPTDSANLVGYSGEDSEEIAAGKFDWSALVSKAGDVVGVVGAKALESRQARKAQQDVLKAQTEQAKWAALGEAAKVKGSTGGSAGASTMNVVLIGLLGASVLVGAIFLFKNKPESSEDKE
jgi:hypothetical protein